MKDLPLFYAPHLRDDLQLPEGEAQHALRVLRAQVGDEFLVTDGQGTLFETRVTGVDRRHCLLSILHEEPWQKYYDLRLLAHCREGLSPERTTIDRVFRPESKILLMIGPEGDFSVEEIQSAVASGCQPISLGSSRLRTETAGLIGLQWLHTLDMIGHAHPSAKQPTK